ncbi:hypothetical protein F66182_7613 [Fusarium sp. NRRL 66182]|nr:hypothetical protein F66182_7613 [Fusarium sp. NRRL 66182]
MVGSPSDASKFDQQRLRRSTRTNRGQAPAFLQRNYAVGEAASRPSPGSRRRRRRRRTIASRSLGRNRVLASSGSGPKRRRVGKGPASETSSGDDDEEAEEEEEEEEEEELILDTIVVATSAPRGHSRATLPQQQMASPSPQKTHQPQSLSPFQRESACPNSSHAQSAQQGQFMLLGGHLSLNSANSQLVDSSVVNEMILDEDPLFDGFGEQQRQSGESTELDDDIQREFDQLDCDMQREFDQVRYGIESEFEQLADDMRMEFDMDDPDVEFASAMSQYMDNMDRIVMEDHRAWQEEELMSVDEMEELWDNFMNDPQRE